MRRGRPAGRLARAEGPRYKRPVTEAVFSREHLPPALLVALDAALDTKALAPTLLHVTEIAGYTDWVLLLSGRSDRHVRGITEAIMDAMRQRGVKPIGTDGLEDHLWDLLDYDDFIVHVFYHPVRSYYDLESMWRDAPRAELDLSDEVMDVSGLAHLPPPEVMPGYRGQEFGAFEDELGPDEAFDEEAYDDDEGDDDFADGDDLGPEDGEYDEGDEGDDDFDEVYDEGDGDFVEGEGEAEAAGEDEAASEGEAAGDPRRKAR